MEILYRAIRVYIWCNFESNPIFLLIGRTNTRRNAVGRLEEKISIAGVLPHGDKVRPLEKDAHIHHAPINPHPLIDENIRTSLLQMSQAITSQSQAATTHFQSMTTQTNREVMPHPNQKSLIWLPV